MTILCEIINNKNMKKIKIIKLLLSIILIINLFCLGYTFAGDDISKEWFTIEVSDYTPMWKWTIGGSTLSEKAKELSDLVIDVLMVPIGVIALLIISIWAGYMIFYNWKEEFLTKWRSMIFTWFLALFIALCSAYIIKAVLYMLYS